MMNKLKLAALLLAAGTLTAQAKITANGIQQFGSTTHRVVALLSIVLLIKQGGTP